MKIGLFLQDNRLSIDEMNKHFNKVLKDAKENKLDLLVFPEHFYCPDESRLENLNYVDYGDDSCNYTEIIDILRKYAKKANCPIIVSRSDLSGFIYGLFISPFEEEIKYYGKHIATELSSFDLGDYKEVVNDIFYPIEYKGYNIGITICYDSNNPLFSRCYDDVDILINLTGGHVDYKKWYIYQRARALENKCNYLCTMAYYRENAKNDSYVFGFDGYGKTLDFININNYESLERNTPNGLYVFEIDKKRNDFEEFNKNKSEVDQFTNGIETISKNISLELSIDDIEKLIVKDNKIENGLYIKNINGDNLVIAYLENNEIEDPLNVLKLLYSKKLKEIKNKKYLIINKWESLDYKYYETKLSTILKSRAAENFCAVILLSNIKNQCIQVGLNKNIQLVKYENNKYGIDFKRATGPESFWKNNKTIGVKAKWRDTYERLLNSMLILNDKGKIL